MKSPKMKRRMMFWRQCPKHCKTTASSEPSILTPKQLDRLVKPRALHLVRILLRVIIKTKAVSIQLTPALCSITPKQAGLLGSTQNGPIVLANSTPQVCMRPRPRQKAHLIATPTGAEVQVGDLVESFPAIEPV